MDSNQRSIIMPLIQDTEYPVEKRQQDLVFHQLRPTKKRTLVGRIIFTLSAIVIGSFVLAKLFGPGEPLHPHPHPRPHPHPPRIFGCQTLESGSALNLTFSTHPGKDFFLHESLSAASIEISRDSIEGIHFPHHSQEHQHQHLEGLDGKRKGKGEEHSPPPQATILVEISRSLEKDSTILDDDEMEGNKKPDKQVVQACTVDVGHQVGLGIFPPRPPKHPKEPEKSSSSPPKPEPNPIEVLSQISLKISLPSDLPLLPLTFGGLSPPHRGGPCKKTLWFKIKKSFQRLVGKKDDRSHRRHRHHHQRQQVQEDKVEAEGDALTERASSS